ncbi:hypothetical protein PILCRDRAFT_826141, partial [Piloderma croceum F 1598]
MSDYYQDQRPPHYQPPGGQPPAQIGQNDFVSDEDFEKMVTSGSFGGPPKRQPEKVIGPEDFGEWNDRPRPQHGSGAGGFPEPTPSRFDDDVPGYRRPSPSAAPSGREYGYPEGPGSRPSTERDEYIEPGVGFGGYGPGRGGPPARQRAERDDYLEPGVGPGRYGAGRGGMPSGPGGERDDFIEPDVGSGHYGARNEEYHERPHDGSYGSAGYGRGGGESNYGRGGYGREEPTYGEDDYGRSGQGYGRGEPGHGRGGEHGYGRDGSYGRGRGRGYSDESEFAPGPGRGGYGGGRDGYGEGGYTEEGYGRGRGRGGKGGYEEDAYSEEAYGSGRPPPQAHPYAHLPALASAHDEYTDPELFHQAAQKLHHSQQEHDQHSPGAGGKYDTFESHFANHAQAYGSDADHSSPMDTDAIGSAAAFEALKMSVAQNQSRPASSASPSPSGSPPHKTQPKQEEESGGGFPAQDTIMAMAMGKLSGLGGLGGGSSSHASENPQDKIIALAMSQAGKLFDKKNGGAGGGNPAAKVDAMHSAASTAMRLCGQYKTTGKVNLEPGEMQNLMGAAMSFI